MLLLCGFVLCIVAWIPNTVIEIRKRKDPDFYLEHIEQWLTVLQVAKAANIVGLTVTLVGVVEMIFRGLLY